LYFLGLPWLYTWGSGRFSGVARDALHVAGRIESLLGRTPEQASRPATDSRSEAAADTLAA
jgi:putative flavoprotein involved in K+ transport